MTRNTMKGGKSVLHHTTTKTKITENPPIIRSRITVSNGSPVPLS